MKSTRENPLAYFDEYLQNGIFKDFEKFYSPNAYHNVDGVDSISRDNNNHIIRVTFINQPSKIVEDRFEDRVKAKMQIEVDKSQALLEHIFQENYSNKTKVQSHAQFFRTKLKSQKSYDAIKKFPFLLFYFNLIENVINKYSKGVVSYSFTPSFNLLGEDSSVQKAKIEKLYQLLTDNPPLIGCEKTEFLRAFSGQEVEQGIQWLVTGKNKLTSKVSLLYFIDFLISKGHLDASILNDLNKHIAYVFRDKDGNELKNIKQSKSTVSANPAYKDRIDTIISSLS